MYPNRTYGVASPTDLWKVVTRVLVGYSDLSVSIYCFAWYKPPSSSPFNPSFVDYWFVCIWFPGHWYWNVSSAVLEICPWVIYKLGTQICFLHRFMEGRVKGSSSVISLFVINLVNGSKSIISSSSSSLFVILLQSSREEEATLFWCRSK